MTENLGSFEGKYEILERIGEGGMGAVFKVRHRLMNELRVIKTMRANLTNREESRERFYREARIAARVKHENIAQVLDFSMESGTAFLVIEYIDGVTLLDLLAIHGPPSLPLGLEIAQQSLRALAVVHRTGIIHRDISPDNLMLATDAEGNPKVKLIDLGLAKITEAESGLTKEGFFLGKLRYASPEQFQADQDTSVGPWSDVYSFGLVLYELLTGRYPISGHDMAGLMAGHLTLPPKSFAKSDPDNLIPEDVRRAVLKSLEKKPEARYPSGEPFHDQIRLLQIAHPVGPQEKAEAVRLSERPPTIEEAPPGPEQELLVSKAFPIDHSSGGSSTSIEEMATADRPVIQRPLSADPDLAGLTTADDATERISREETLGATIIRDQSTAPPDDPPTVKMEAAPEKPIPPPFAAKTPSKTPAGQSSRDPSLVVERSPTAPQTSSPRRHRKRLAGNALWLGAAAGVLLAVVVILFLTGALPMLGRGGEADRAPSPADAGRLVIEASPWAEIVRCTDEAGTEIDLDGALYTPLVLTVPPGRYQVVLRNQSFGERTVQAEVLADQTTDETVSFAEIDENQLLRSLGLLQ